MSVTQSDRTLPPEWDDAFAELCGRHRGRLIRWLTAIFGARDAEDIAQEALVRLFLRPGLLGESEEEGRDVWPWLAVVARNVGRDMARHNAQSTAVDHVTLADVPDEKAVWDQVSARDDAERLVRALRRLSSRDRALIRLRDVQGVPMAELAAMLGVTDNTARQQLFRARRRLADTYTALGGERGLGVFGTLGLRVREVFRRHWNAFEALGLGSPAVLAAIAPCLACLAAIAGGVVARPVSPVTAAFGTAGGGAQAFAPLDTDRTHGTGGSAAGTVYAAPSSQHPDRTPPRRRHGIPPPPVQDVHQHGGGAHVDVTWHQNPVFNNDGRSATYEIYYDAPIIGRVGFTSEGDNYGGQSTACSIGVFTCT